MPTSASTATKRRSTTTKSKSGATKRTASPRGKLVIVESPAKARTIGRYLGSGYTVKASMGHIRDLPKSTLGVDVDADFTPKYLIPRDKSKVVKELKDSVQGAKDTRRWRKSRKTTSVSTGSRSSRRASGSCGW